MVTLAACGSTGIGSEGGSLALFLLLITQMTITTITITASTTANRHPNVTPIMIPVDESSFDDEVGSDTSREGVGSDTSREGVGSTDMLTVGTTGWVQKEGLST